MVTPEAFNLEQSCVRTCLPREKKQKRPLAAPSTTTSGLLEEPERETNKGKERKQKGEKKNPTGEERIASGWGEASTSRLGSVTTVRLHFRGTRFAAVEALLVCCDARKQNRTYFLFRSLWGFSVFDDLRFGFFDVTGTNAVRWRRVRSRKRCRNGDNNNEEENVAKNAAKTWLKA